MSNQIGQMLSFIFLGLFIFFSGEIMCYQQISARCMALTSEIALSIQKGDSIQEIYDNRYYTDFFEIIISKDNQENYEIYTIETFKEYQSFSNLFSFFNNTINCQLVVNRKEYYG